MTPKNGEISEKLREVIPLLELARMLNVSRPTLYKYMEYYDSGNFEKIPTRVHECFDYMSEGEHTRNQVKAFLSGVPTGVPDEDSDDDEHAPVTSNRRCNDSDNGWSVGSIPNLCVSENGVAMVIFRDPMDGECTTRLLVFIEVDGVEVPVGTYLPEPGMKFVRVDNLIPVLDYRYRLEQDCGGEKVVSPARQLKLR